MNTIHLSDQERQLLIDLLEREILSLHKEIMTPMITGNS
jgi:hypothetical protein